MSRPRLQFSDRALACPIQGPGVVWVDRMLVEQLGELLGPISMSDALGELMMIMVCDLVSGMNP